MDMIIKALANAGEGIDRAERPELDRLAGYTAILQRAVTVVEDLGCEKDDVEYALTMLRSLATKYGRRRRRLRDDALENIDLQKRNGLNTTGMTPCSTGEALREALTTSVVRVRAATHRQGADVALTIGHRETTRISPDSIEITDEHIRIGDDQWLLRGITAVSRLDGFGFLARGTLVRVDCDVPELGMTTNDVRALKPGTKVTVLEETSGESADGQERTYPAGTLGEVTEVRTLPEPQGLAVTVIIGPRDGEEAIVNVFDEGDAWFPLELADAKEPCSKGDVDQTFARPCQRAISSLTADDWELFDKPGRDEAAKALNAALETAINADGATVDTVWTAMEPIQRDHASLGADDTEGRAMIQDVIDKVFGN